MSCDDNDREKGPQRENTESYPLLRGSTSTENFFLCFNGMILLFGQLLEHGDTVMKIYFLKLLLPWNKPSFVFLLPVTYVL